MVAYKTTDRGRLVPPPKISWRRLARSVRGRVEAARKRAGQERPGMDWDSLLGAAGVRLDQLGPSYPKAGIARGEEQREGGADRQ